MTCDDTRLVSLLPSCTRVHFVYCHFIRRVVAHMLEKSMIVPNRRLHATTSIDTSFCMCLECGAVTCALNVARSRLYNKILGLKTIYRIFHGLVARSCCRVQIRTHVWLTLLARTARHGVHPTEATILGTSYDSYSKSDHFCIRCIMKQK